MYKFLCLLFFPLWSYGQYVYPGAARVKQDRLPAEIKVRGKIEDAWHWKDRLGENILVTSVLGPYQSKNDKMDEGTTSIELFAAHYVKTDSVYKVRWRLNDFVKDCGLDLVCRFISPALSISDLNNNGIAETKLQYKMACHGDVSPAYMKLIMHEDTVKYALRGNMWISGGSADTVFRVTEKNVNLETLPVKPNEFDKYEQSMGRYETEKDFVKAPREFLLFARREWLRYVKDALE